MKRETFEGGILLLMDSCDTHPSLPWKLWLTLELLYPVRLLGELEDVSDLSMEVGRVVDGLFVVLFIKLFLGLSQW